MAGTVDVEQLERAEQLLVRVEAVYGQDLATHHAAYQRTLRTVVAEHGITVPVQLRSTTISDPVTELVDEGWRAEWLHGRARSPLPALKAAAGLLRSRGRSAQDAPAVSGAGRSR